MSSSSWSCSASPPCQLDQEKRRFAGLPLRGEPSHKRVEKGDLPSRGEDHCRSLAASGVQSPQLWRLGDWRCLRWERGEGWWWEEQWCSTWAGIMQGRGLGGPGERGAGEPDWGERG